MPDGSATAKAIDYSLNRWEALTAYLDNGVVQIDNNHIENLVRPWAMGYGLWAERRGYSQEVNWQASVRPS